MLSASENLTVMWRYIKFNNNNNNSVDLSLSMRSLESLTKDEVCPIYTFKILVRYLAKLYVEVPHAETMGCIAQLALWIFGKP